MLLFLCHNRPVQAYVEAPHSLGQVISLSSNIMVVRVEQVDKTKNLIVYRKVRDLKGKHPTDIIRHNIGRGGFNPREWQYTMEWAEVGKTAVFFHNGGASETCIGNYWYQAYAGGDWWNLSHGEPFLLRSFAGNVEKLAAAVTDIVAGQRGRRAVHGGRQQGRPASAPRPHPAPAGRASNSTTIPSAISSAGAARTSVAFRACPASAIIPRSRASIPRRRRFPAWTSTATARPISAWPARAEWPCCKTAANRSTRSALPGATGCRAAVWADYNGDGKPDLLLATPSGPRLYTNLGGTFRDDSHLLPHEPAYNLTAAAWLDYDGDGRPDLLLGNGFHGLRLYRNKGPVDAGAAPLRLGKWSYIGPFPNPNGQGFNTVYPPEKDINLTRKYGGKNGEEAVWREGKFTDGEINNLALFRPGQQRRCRRLSPARDRKCTGRWTCPFRWAATTALTVWLNGQKILAENVDRACAPDQNHDV